ncbi:MAG: hypothetical protein AABZ83_12015 [candidate division NC10 bacterium]
MTDKDGGPDEPTLFALPPAVPPAPAPAPADPKRGARLREANRSQLAWGRIDLDAQLPDDHPARAVASGSWGGQRPSLASYVAVTEPTDGAPAPPEGGSGYALLLHQQVLAWPSRLLRRFAPRNEGCGGAQRSMPGAPAGTS